MKRWRSYKIWLPVFILSSLGLVSGFHKTASSPVMSMEKELALKERQNQIFSYGKEPPIDRQWKKEVPFKPKSKGGISKDYSMTGPQAPITSPAPAPTPTPTKPNYADIGLKIGSGMGGLMSLLNIIEKILKWFQKKKGE